MLRMFRLCRAPLIVCRGGWLTGSTGLQKKPARRVGCAQLRGLRAAFSRPGARAVARAGSPHAGAILRGQLALAVSALAAARDLDGHGAVLADLSADGKRGIARVTD